MKYFALETYPSFWIWHDAPLEASLPDERIVKIKQQQQQKKFIYRKRKTITKNTLCTQKQRAKYILINSDEKNNRAWIVMSVRNLSVRNRYECIM